MAQVSVRVNGYSYILGCADGQEDHLRALAADVDRRIDGIKVAAGPSGEARLLLMAALVLSDELYELRKLMGRPDLTPMADPMPEPVARPEPKTARRLRAAPVAPRRSRTRQSRQRPGKARISREGSRKGAPPEAGQGTRPCQGRKRRNGTGERA